MKKKIGLKESDIRNIVKKIIKEGRWASDDSFSKSRGETGYAHGSKNMPDPNYELENPNNINPYCGYNDSDEMYQDLKDFQRKERRYNRDNLRRAMKSADERPLHRKGSLNRELE